MTKAMRAPDAPAEYVWTFPGSPVAIHVPLTVISQLREHAFSGLSSPYPKETGGVLLGRADPGRVHITGFEPLESVRRSRHFVLSNEDKVALRSMVESRTRQVIGYYRTDLRDGIQLANEDIDLIDRVFCDPTHVFLVMRVEQNGVPAAGFFFWDGGTIFRDETFLSFPLDERLLFNWTIPTSPDSQQLRVASELGRQTTASRTRGKSPYLLTAAVILLAIAAATIAFLVFRSPSFRPSRSEAAKEVATVDRSGMASPLSLSATRVENALAITWDSRLPALSDAKIGVLTIQDGEVHRELPLTSSQLQMNKLIYAAKSSRVEVTLEVFSSTGKSASEAVMVILDNMSVRSRRIDPGPRTDLANTLNTHIQATSETPSDSSGAIQRPLTSPHSPRRDDSHSRATLLDVPPLTPTTTHVNVAQLKGPDFALPSISAPVIPNSPPASASTRTDTPSIIHTLVVEPPKVLRRVQPIVPPNLMSTIKRRVDVDVRVSIGTDGRISAAAPAASSVLNEYLAQSAVRAALQWRFQPARRGNIPVPSDMVVRFSFGPEK